jgi:menaquinone-dependent protoporphyrinogen IX oxidase
MRSPPAKKLAKGDAVAVDSEGHKVQLESVATIQKIAHRSYHLGIFQVGSSVRQKKYLF